MHLILDHMCGGLFDLRKENLIKLTGLYFGHLIDLPETLENENGL